MTNKQYTIDNPLVLTDPLFEGNPNEQSFVSLSHAQGLKKELDELKAALLEDVLYEDRGTYLVGKYPDSMVSERLHNALTK